MANMTFKANLLPNSNLGYNLGSSNLKWNVYGDLKGNAATATKLSNTPNNTTTFLRGDNTWSNTLSGTTLKITNNSNTVTIGSLNTSYCHIYNSADIPFIFNKRVESMGGFKYYDTNNWYFTNSHGSFGYNNTNYTVSTGSLITNGELRVNDGAQMLCSTNDSNNSATYNGGIQLREYKCQTTSCTHDLYHAPGITFHWGGRWAYKLALYNGGLYWGSDLIVLQDSRTYSINITGSAGSSTTTTYLQMQYTSNASGFNTLMNNNWDKSKLYTNWWDSSSTKMPYIYGSGIIIPHADSNYRSTLYAACNSNLLYYGWSSNLGTSYNWYLVWLQGNSVTGAVWNDYAEYREAETIEPGYILCEKGDGSLSKSTKRCQEFAGVSSDTWGFALGETEKAKTPIAVSGRVLVYVKDKVKVNDYICSGPDGIGLKMRWWEKILYPHRVVGIVSEIPTYKKWGGGENADRDPVDVNSRIWIKCCN